MGNIYKHGSDMYKKTMNQQPAFYKETKPLKPSIPHENKKPVYTEPQKKADKSNNKKENISKDSKYTRVAKFLILIGSEQAAGILAELDPQQVSEISKEIALTKVIKPDERDEILAEFQTLFANRNFQPYSFTGFSRGGIETARSILYTAKGPDKGEELLNKAVPQSKENLFGFLEEFSSEQIIMLLKEESAQTSALILSRIPSKLSAGVLSKLPHSQKPEILKRIAYQKEISPEVLEHVSAGIKEKARHISGNAKDIKIDGMQTLAAILKQSDYSFGDRLINEIENEDPQIGLNLKEQLYTLDDVIEADDRSIQDKLKTMQERDIAILLKGREKEFTEKILSCVSAGRRKIIREEFEILGAVPKRDCEAIAKDFLSWFRNARENGDIILSSDEDVFL
ncbi:MAG: flagellar motor switch protein FliG [Treponema sp.]|nr:flagellar motor switch protein FliG [Treponema sp.]